MTSVANLKALRQLTGQSLEFDEHGLRAAVATPLWTGTTGTEIVELLPRHEGVPLDLIRLRSPSPFQGDILAKIFNALVTSAHRLHDIGVLHRDITPSNILLSSVGRQVKI